MSLSDTPDTSVQDQSLQDLREKLSKLYRGKYEIQLFLQNGGSIACWIIVQDTTLTDENQNKIEQDILGHINQDSDIEYRGLAVKKIRISDIGSQNEAGKSYLGDVFTQIEEKIGSDTFHMSFNNAMFYAFGSSPLEQDKIRELLFHLIPSRLPSRLQFLSYAEFEQPRDVIRSMREVRSGVRDAMTQ